MKNDNQNTSANLNKGTIRFSIKSREGEIYGGDVAYISSYNEKGKFDVLPGHANFISLINTSIFFKEISGEVKEIYIDSALLRVKNRIAEVYIGVGSPAQVS